MQFEWKFTGLITGSSPCGCVTCFLIEWFLAELWPLDNCVFLVVFHRSLWITKTCPDYSSKLLLGFYLNFTEMISFKSCCAKKCCFLLFSISTEVNESQKTCPDNSSETTGGNSTKLTEMISTKSSCAYYQYFPVQWFLTELSPFKDYNFFPDHCS